MKRFLSILLVVMMLVPSALAMELSEPGVLPITTDDVTITIGLRHVSLTTDYEVNYLTQLIEEKTGVKLDFVLFPTDVNESKQKLSLMIAGGQKLPDILYLPLSDIERFTYGSGGYFLPLNDYLENDAFYWNLAMDTWSTAEQKAELMKYAASPDGNIYGYPAYCIDPGDATAQGLWINKLWCENLNLELPTTTDELYTVLKAFKEQDANGNGDLNDEIPLIGHKDWVGHAETYLMNSFVYDVFSQDFSYQLSVEDGKLYAPFITDAYREGLKYIHKLMDEGLLSPLTFSQSKDELRSIMCAPNDQDTIVGAFAGHPSPIFGADGTVERVYEYTALPAMIGPEGVQYSPYTGQIGAYDTYITSDCENLDLAFRVIDAVAEQEISLSMRYGEKDVNWTYTDEGEVNHKYLEGFSAVYAMTPTEDVPVPWTSENNTLWHVNTFNMLPPQLFAGLVTTPYTSEYRQYQMSTLWYSSVPLRYDKHPNETALKLVFTQDEIDNVSEIESSLRSYVEESMARFILGDLDVEKDWDSYKAELEGIGLDYYLETAQTAYDRLNGK